jgi:hypothetical protein
MARQFGSHSMAWPLGTTIDETFVFEDEDGNPVDLTDCDIRMQLRVADAVRDPETGAGDTDPVMELVTRANLYPTPPAWPVIEAFELGADPDDPQPSDGTIRMHLPAAETWALAPTNDKIVLVYDIEIIDENTGDVLPLLRGKVKTGPRRTLGLPA